MEFLRDENRTNDWGQKLYQGWLANGRSAPELVMTTWGTPPTDTTPPAAPTGLTAAAVSRSQVHLARNAATDPVRECGIIPA